MPKRKTHKEFLEQVKDRPFTVLGRYVNSFSKVDFKCNACGNEWLAKPSNVLSGQGCPFCAKSRCSGSLVQKAGERFVCELSSKSIVLAENYTGCHALTLFRCCVCGVEWETRPKIISQGAGCPVCRRVGVKSKRYENKILEESDGWIKLDVSTPAHAEAVMKIDKLGWMFIKKLGGGRIFLNGKYPSCVCDGHVVKVHRLLLPDAEMVDHIDGNPLNNCRSNLRECGPLENVWNSKVQGNSTTGVAGVTRSKKDGKFDVRISVRRRRIYLGRFVTIEEAATARRGGELKYFGKFAPNRDLDSSGTGR